MSDAIDPRPAELRPRSQEADPDLPELDTLTTEELRQRAFAVAEGRHDVGFFWDLLRHLPQSHDLAMEDGSPGHAMASITETVQILREMFGGHLDEGFGDAEPLVRAHLVDYLRGSAEPAG